MTEILNLNCKCVLFCNFKHSRVVQSTVVVVVLVAEILGKRVRQQEKQLKIRSIHILKKEQLTGLDRFLLDV